MEKSKALKINTFIRQNMNRLLLLAVIFSGCFALRFAAYGKYVDFINDYTSARAGNFFFSSNYLKESTSDSEAKYPMSNFDGNSFELDMEIRNYDNAFNFNREGVDFYYYLSTELYQDSEMTVPYDGEYYTSISYDIQGKHDAAMVRSVKSAMTGIAKNPFIDLRENAEYNLPESYKKLGLLRGYAPADNGTGDIRGKGKQVARISLSWTNKCTSQVFLRVTAHTVLPTKTSNVHTDDYLTIEKLDAIHKAADVVTVPDVLENYDKMTGVYDSEISAIFILDPTGASKGIIKGTRYVSTSDYEVRYTLNCDSDAVATVYYNPDKLAPDESLGDPKQDPNYPNMMYLPDITVPANGSYACYFYRRNMSATINSMVEKDSDLMFIQKGLDEPESQTETEAETETE